MPQCPSADAGGGEALVQVAQMAAPPRETFKVGLDRALNSLIQLRISLLIAGGLELDL